MCQQQPPVSICIYNISNPHQECVFCKTSFDIMLLIAPCILQPICKHTQTVSTPSPHILFSVQSTTAIMQSVPIVLHCIHNIIFEPWTTICSIQRHLLQTPSPTAALSHVHADSVETCVHCPTLHLQTRVAVGSTQTCAHIRRAGAAAHYKVCDC